MKIDNNNMLGGINLYRINSVEQKEAAAQSSSVRKTAGTDRVEFSVPREQLDKLRKALEAMPDVRPERVASVRQQIAGTYDVSGQSVAAKMLGVNGNE